MIYFVHDRQLTSLGVSDVVLSMVYIIPFFLHNFVLPAIIILSVSHSRSDVRVLSTRVMSIILIL